VNWTYDDGGREAAGYKGQTGDCVTRSVVIVGGFEYGAVYDELKAQLGKGHSPRDGILKNIWQPSVNSLGWTWTPTMAIGSGCKIHLRADELPTGRLLVSVSRHLTAVIDGTAYDTHDPSREGTRCVYGYWTFLKKMT